MRYRFRTLLTLLIDSVVALSLTNGQDPLPPLQPKPVVPLVASPAQPAPTPARDVSKLTDTQKQAWVTAQRGALWLYNMNAPNRGCFYYGFLPALNRPLEGDNYLYQAAAAATMALAAPRGCSATATLKLVLLRLSCCCSKIPSPTPKDAKVRYHRDAVCRAESSRRDRPAGGRHSRTASCRRPTSLRSPSSYATSFAARREPTVRCVPAISTTMGRNSRNRPPR